MKNLISMEFDKAFKNAWFFIALALGCALAVMAAAESVYNFFDWGYDVFDSQRYAPLGSSGSFASWIGIGRMNNSMLPTLFFMLAPLFAVLPYSWSLRTELATGAILPVMARAPRLKYFAAKFLATFCVGGVSIAVPLVANFVVLACFIPGYTPDPGDGYRTIVMPYYLFSNLHFSMPLLYIAAITACDFVLCGTWAVFVAALFFFIDNRVVLMAAPYLGMVFVRYANTTAIPQMVDYARIPQIDLIDAMYPGTISASMATPDPVALCLVALASLGVSAAIALVFSRRDIL